MRRRRNCYCYWKNNFEKSNEYLYLLLLDTLFWSIKKYYPYLLELLELDEEEDEDEDEEDDDDEEEEEDDEDDDDDDHLKFDYFDELSAASITAVES